MKLTSELKAKIEDLLKERIEGQDTLPLHDEVFGDIFIYIGKKPAVIIDVYNKEKNIFIGKNA